MTIDIEDPKMNKAVFSPLTVRHAILEPVKYLFSRVAPPDLRYSCDPKETKIVIDTKNSKNQDTITQNKPRILLSAGAYSFSRSGLTDNMAQQAPFDITGGNLDSINMLMVSGNSTLLIEAEEEGVALLMADMASNFVTWSAPHICNTFGFKNFGFPLSVSDCQMETSDDTEKFRVTIGIPWIFESHWTLKEDALKLKDFIFSLTAT